MRKPAVTLTTTILMVVAGVIFAASAVTARGTDLRAERASDLRQLVLNRANEVRTRENSVERLRRNVDTLALQHSTPQLTALRKKIERQRVLAALSPQTGDGVVVTLNDAPHKADSPLDEGTDPNLLLIHQEDVQAVINAMWRGGATAITVMDQRIVNTSAVQCVGSTVLVNGKVFSPPFYIKAIGTPAKLLKSLENDDSILLLKDLARVYGLTYEATVVHNLVMDPYSGATAPRYAQQWNIS